MLAYYKTIIFSDIMDNL